MLSRAGFIELKGQFSPCAPLQVCANMSAHSPVLYKVYFNIRVKGIFMGKFSDHFVKCQCVFGVKFEFIQQEQMSRVYKNITGSKINQSLSPPL